MYATEQDIIDAIGEDALLLLADRDRDMVIDSPVVDAALSDASGEIDGYVAAKYDLPLKTISALIKQICIDIAIYRLCDQTTITDLRSKRYTDGIKTLMMVARGDIQIGIPTNQPSSSGAATLVSGNSRVFGRKNLL